jgi:hypothetical protein
LAADAVFSGWQKNMSRQHDLRAIAEQFQIPGKFISAVPFGCGHINDTFAAAFQAGAENHRYIVQRLNHAVFKNPVAVMENARRVTQFIPARDGQSWFRDEAENIWRARKSGLRWRAKIFAPACWRPGCRSA